MNEAKSLFDAGDLDGAINAVLTSVKSNPTDVSARTFLFELSCFAGDWARADKQLDVIGHQSTTAMMGAHIYRQCVEAERRRERLFSEGLMPEFLATPPAYVGDLISAINRLREGNVAEARELLDKAEEERPAFTCRVNGAEVSDFRDYNDATASVLEVIVKGEYVWVPLEQIERIEFTQPQNLRDLFWMQAKMETTNGTNGEVLVPTLYVNSYKHSDNQVRLGRMTNWRDAGEELFLGEGTKLFWMDGADKSILELREIEFTPDAEAETEETDVQAGDTE